jgi:hypothetical protein
MYSDLTLEQLIEKLPELADAKKLLHFKLRSGVQCTINQLQDYFAVKTTTQKVELVIVYRATDERIREILKELMEQGSIPSENVAGWGIDRLKLWAPATNRWEWCVLTTCLQQNVSLDMAMVLAAKPRR